MSGRMPYFCYIHNGVYVSGEDEGCQHPECVSFREQDVPPLGVMFGVVPGGSKDTEEYRFHMDFDKGMDRYARARRNGLEPRATTVAAVDEAEATAASHQRAKKKLGDRAEGLKTVKGVD